MPPPNQPPPQESGSNKNNNENSNKNNNENNNNDDKNQKLQSTLETLHREMDVAEYTKIRGQNRRVTRKDLSLQRTRKRKALEKEDYETMMEENELLDINMPIAFIKKQKLRGSKKVLEEDVLEASLPLNNSSFANYAAASAVQEDEDEDEEENDEEEEEELDEEELDEEEKELEEEEENEQDQEENELGDENDDQENDDYQNQQEQQKEDLKTESEQKQPEESQKQPPNSTNITNTTTSQKKPPPSNSQKGKKRGPYKKKIGKKSSDQKQVRGKRRLFKLKNFKSFKMAQRHGDALGAHARGQHRLAIAQLQQVAKDAPSAPQVYSSLGMVYHDMYQSCWKKVSSLMQEQQQQQEEQTQTQMTDTRNGIVQEAMNVSSPTNTADITTATATAAGDTVTTTKTNSDANTNAAALNKYIPIQYQEPLHLAQKAYGSYHIAAILCKKDYSLWLRAADTACDIAYLYGQLPRLSSNIDNPLLFQTLVAEQQTRWYKEAQRDYQTADNLHPPGIDVPTKLAAVHMELGQLSEALTIWTDLVQQSAKAQSQSQSQIQFHHTAWKLYADCLLQIGYECQEFNNGKDQNKNYMFRRWLKKFAAEFNWKERRLQALVLALEAAAGSHACRALMEWMRQRAIRMSASVSASASNGGNSSGNSSEKKKTVETAATDDTTTTDKPQQEINEQEFEKEKQLLLKRNEEELAAFDQTTENMMEVLQNDVIEGSKASKDTAVEERQAQRSKMTESQKAQVDQLDGEYQEARKDPSKEQVESSSPAATSNENKEAPGQDPSPATLAVESSPSLEQRNMPLSASSGEVSRIAAELMKLMLSTDLYQGARLVGEAVSLYLRERAQLHDKRTTARRRLDESSNMFGGSLFSTKFQTYDEVRGNLLGIALSAEVTRIRFTAILL